MENIDMEWKYIKQLKDKENIREIEIKYNIELPSALKELILSCNGGRPKRNIFNTKNNKEKVMKLLLSYNKDDKENRRYLPDMTIAEELQAEVSVFKSYEDLEDYSKYMGAKIYNATNPSAIDAFERIDLSKL